MLTLVVSYCWAFFILSCVKHQQHKEIEIMWHFRNRLQDNNNTAGWKKSKIRVMVSTSCRRDGYRISNHPCVGGKKKQSHANVWFSFRDTSGQGRFCTIFRSYSRGAQVRTIHYIAWVTIQYYAHGQKHPSHLRGLEHSTNEWPEYIFRVTIFQRSCNKIS